MPPYATQGEQWPVDGPPISEEQVRKAMGSTSHSWVCFPKEFTVGDMLSCPDYVVPQFAVVYVIARGGKFHKAFLEKHGESILKSSRQ